MRPDLAFAGHFVAERFEREVSATPAQFERDLRMAWPAGVEAVGPGHLCVHDGDIRLDVHLEPGGVRRLGLFELPQLRVRYAFSGADEGARRRLLAALDRAMQRGGG